MTKQKTTSKWIKEFNENYDINDPNQWVVGIVVSAICHRRTEKLGTDASYITKKLLELIENLILQKQKEIDELKDQLLDANEQYEKSTM